MHSSVRAQNVLDKIINALSLITLCFSVAVLSFLILLVFYFLSFVEFQPALFLVLFLFFGQISAWCF